MLGRFHHDSRGILPLSSFLNLIGYFRFDFCPDLMVLSRIGDMIHLSDFHVTHTSLIL